MNEKIDVNVETLQPFTRLLMTIGELPTSYLMSMTYYEQIIWFTKYLQDTVIPTINNNAQAVEEVQQIVMDLQDYINNYFDNLDLQEEVNTKIDEMVEDGTLERIINQEILGEIQEDLAEINSNNTIFIGDSYGASSDSWIDKLATIMGLTIGTNAYKIAQSGYGFARTNMQFLTLLQNQESNIPNKNLIKNVIVAGGLNDTNAESESSISTAITYFCNYVNQTYPNANIYIACIGWHENPTINDSHSGLREKVVNQVLPAYSQAGRNKNTFFLDGPQYIMHYYNFYGEDASHPNASAQSYIARGIHQAMHSPYKFTSTAENISLTSGGHVNVQIKENKLIARFYGNLSNDVLPTGTDKGNKVINLTADKLAHYIRYVNDNSFLLVTCNVRYDTNDWIPTPAKISINTNGILQLQLLKCISNDITGINLNNNPIVFDLLYF